MEQIITIADLMLLFIPFLLVQIATGVFTLIANKKDIEWIIRLLGDIQSRVGQLEQRSSNNAN